MAAHLLASISIILLIPILVAANCNIDSAGLQTSSNTDGLVVTKVGVVATFRLGCAPGTPEPQLHAESDSGKYLVVSSSNKNKEFKEVSFIEEINVSKSRWIEVKIYDDETYQKLLQARQSGSSESYYKPMKSISVSHNGISGGPLVKMEAVASLALVAVYIFAHTLRSKILN